MIKKLLTKEEEAKRQKKNQYIIGGVLIILMFLSVFGIVVSNFGKNGDDGISETNYKGYSLIKGNGIYELDYNGKRIRFFNNPNNLTEIESNVSLTLSKINGKPLYLYSEDSNAESLVLFNLQYPTSLRINRACLENETCIYENSTMNYAIKNCNDNFILIKRAEKNKIYSRKNCVFIEGKEEDFKNVIDVFFLKLIGI